MPSITDILTGKTQSGTGAYGTVPATSNPLDTQKDAIEGNATNLSELYGLATDVNAFSNKQAALGYQMNMPNYTSILGNLSNNALEESRGGITSDEMTNLVNTAAERGISTGLPTAGITNTSLLRAVGTNTRKQQQQGLSDFSTLMGLTPVGKQFDVNSWLVTPEQQQEAQTNANVLASSPNPTESAAAELAAARNGVSTGNQPTSITTPKTTLPTSGGGVDYTPPSGGQQTTPTTTVNTTNRSAGTGTVPTSVNYNTGAGTQTGDLVTDWGNEWDQLMGGNDWQSYGYLGSDYDSSGNLNPTDLSQNYQTDLADEWSQDWNDLLGLDDWSDYGYLGSDYNNGNLSPNDLSGSAGEDVTSDWASEWDALLGG